MADHEAAAARAPPVAVAPPPATPRTAAAEAKAALADAVVNCFLSAMFVGCAASIALIVARYAFGERYPYAYAMVAAVASKRQPEPPEELLVVEGVHVTMQVHGLEHPGARGGRQGQGTGYVLIPLLVFIVFSMFMLLGLLMQERLHGKECYVHTAGGSLYQ